MITEIRLQFIQHGRVHRLITEQVHRFSIVRNNYILSQPHKVYIKTNTAFLPCLAPCLLHIQCFLLHGRHAVCKIPVHAFHTTVKRTSPIIRITIIQECHCRFRMLAGSGNTYGLINPAHFIIHSVPLVRPFHRNSHEPQCGSRMILIKRTGCPGGRSRQYLSRSDFCL